MFLLWHYGFLSGNGQNSHRFKWKLFADSSPLSLGALLLYNGNHVPYILLRHAVHMRYPCLNMTAHLDSIKYTDFKWKVSGDLKVIDLLLGMH